MTPKKLTREEEISLIKRIRSGEASESELVEANLYLVKIIAKKYARKWVEFSDLIQEGNIGLMAAVKTAVKTFDCSRSVMFSSYAKYAIQHNIRRSINFQVRAIRLPDNVMQKVSRLNQFEYEFVEKPTVEELSKAAGITEEEVQNLISVKKWTRSLDAEIPGTDGLCLIDTIDAASKPSYVFVRTPKKKRVSQSIVSFAPDWSECPNCEEGCNLHSKREREIRGVKTFIVTVGVYRCDRCAKFFTSMVPFTLKWSHFSDDFIIKALSILSYKSYRKTVGLISEEGGTVSVGTLHRWKKQMDELGFTGTC